MTTTDPKCVLRAALRKLWADHAIWTRQYIVAFVSAGADAGEAAGRLLKNQEHLGAAIVLYYGQAAGDALAGLLRRHILIAVDLLNAAKAGDDAEFGKQDQRWSQNAEEIATLLSGANPYWPRRDVVDLLNLHLKLTKDEAVARLGANWAADVSAWDDIFTEIMTVSDTLADGIILQFPERFATAATTTASAEPARRGFARLLSRSR
ncbi:MAG: glycosyltransferase [Ktedonobacterales bacterium]